MKNFVLTFEEFKAKILPSLFLFVLSSVSVGGQDSASQKTAQNDFGKLKTKGEKIIWRAKSKFVRKEFEAIFAKQIADYKAQFAAVKRGEKLKPDCAPDFVLKRPDGATLTCEQVTAERQAKFERIKAINYLKIEIGNIELNGDEAVVFTTQSFSRIVPGSDGRDYTVATDGTIHKEFWVKTENEWRSKGFEEVKQGMTTIDGQPPPPPQNLTYSSNAGQGRSLTKNKILSLKNPFIQIEVDERMLHVGILNFKLKNVARVERYVYASRDENNRVRRLFIAQFESILPGVKGGYTFQIVNAVRLGVNDYQTEVGFFNFTERIRANPGAEAEYTKALLDKYDLKANDDFLVARFARVTSDDKRSELIFFYLENLRDLGFSRAELGQDASRAAETIKLFRDFAARAVKSFKVADGKS